MTDAVRLRDVLRLLGPDLLEPLLLPAGDDVEVCGIGVYDPLSESARPGQIVMAVGVQPTGLTGRALVEWCHQARAAALVIKGEDPDTAAVVAAASDGAVGVLRTPRTTDWAGLLTELRVAIASAGAPSEGRFAAVPDGDLFALANTIEDMVGGRVVIEDPHFKLLAFSRTDNDIDEPRRMTILGRRMPQDWIDALGRKGMFAQMWSSDRPVEDPPRPKDGYAGRLAIAVKSDREILGSIWVAPGRGPLAADADSVLVDAARVAVPHLLVHLHREMQAVDPSNPFLRDFLAGRTSAAAFAREAGVADGHLQLIVLSARGGDAAERDEASAVRLARLASIFAQARRVPSLVSVERGSVFVLAWLPMVDVRRVRQLLLDFAGRAASGAHTRVVVAGSQIVSSLEEVPAQVGVVLAVLGVLLRSDGDVVAATAREVHVPLMLARSREMIRTHPELRSGPVDRLLTHDRAHGTRYVPTLREVLTCVGGTGAAAQRLRVHPNTVRNRLRRIQELTGLDLADPDQRLAAALYLRCLEVV